MRTLLIRPRDPIEGTGFTRIRTLTLPSVAAELGRVGPVRVVDESVEPVPDGTFDLVGITCDTPRSPRAYALADELRARGRRVVLGGTHPTAVPDEALAHADAIVRGEVEGLAERLADDCAAGRLAGVYQATERPELTGVPIPPVDALPRYAQRFQPYPFELTRGCRHACRFCFNRTIHGPGFRRRDLGAVVDAIAARPERLLLAMDDNLANDPEHLAGFAERVAPLGRHWGGQSTLELAEDPALLRHLARSGFAWTFLGVESFSDASLAGENKGFNEVARYAELFDRLRAHGITPFAGIIVGLDGDGPEVFERTWSALRRVRPAACAFTLPVPYPGTAFHRQMDRAGRILTRDAALYDGRHVVLRPARMTPGELEAGYHRLTRAFYGLRGQLRRFPLYALGPTGLSRPEMVLSYLGISLGYWRFHRQLRRAAPRPPR